MRLGADNAGRPRKPTEAKKRAGTYRADRSNPAEPDSPPVEIPDAPVELSPVERQVWAAWSHMLAPRRVVTAADLPALERLVRIHAIVLEAQRSLYADAIDGHPRLVVDVITKFGVSQQPRQELKIIAQYERLLAHYLSRFGLTPADRSKASQLVAPADDGGDLGEFVQ